MTKGQIESKISEAVCKFEMTALFENARESLEQAIKSVIDVNIISTYSDVSTKTGEKIIAVVVDKDIEENFIDK
ncbi:MAG: hypothetical protein K0R92_2613 [Lachnospiraceae bacterium]|nr:hypothetical protein [Lachnospiraceae bacterium]